jgi:hypothetical protein
MSGYFIARRAALRRIEARLAVIVGRIRHFGNQPAAKRPISPRNDLKIDLGGRAEPTVSRVSLAVSCLVVAIFSVAASSAARAGDGFECTENGDKFGSTASNATDIACGIGAEASGGAALAVGNGPEA